MSTLEWREEIRAARDAEIAAHEQQQQAERVRAWSVAAQDEDASPLTNPAGRPTRRLTPEQVCREEYDGFVTNNYLVAEADCRGVLVNQRAEQPGSIRRACSAAPRRGCGSTRVKNSDPGSGAMAVSRTASGNTNGSDANQTGKPRALRGINRWVR